MRELPLQRPQLCTALLLERRVVPPRQCELLTQARHLALARGGLLLEARACPFEFGGELTCEYLRSRLLGRRLLREPLMRGALLLPRQLERIARRRSPLVQPVELGLELGVVPPQRLHTERRIAHLCRRVGGFDRAPQLARVAW